MLTDSGPASSIAYAYNHNGRLKSVTDNGTLKGSYVYNAQEQLAARTLSNMVPFALMQPKALAPSKAAPSAWSTTALK